MILTRPKFNSAYLLMRVVNKYLDTIKGKKRIFGGLSRGCCGDLYFAIVQRKDV
jgi:hypothetical protein